MVRLASAERWLTMLYGRSLSSRLRVLSLLLSAVLLFAQAPPAGNEELHEIDRYIQGEIKLNQRLGTQVKLRADCKNNHIRRPEITGRGPAWVWPENRGSLWHPDTIPRWLRRG